MKRFFLQTALTTALLASTVAGAELSVSINVAPPELLLYAQPPLPEAGEIWTPGYWAWNPDYNDYYWVPGTWVMAPAAGLLWTPGYWAFGEGGYFWHDGYWGSQVGFYGGLNYGYGYNGRGYQGGRWDHGAFRYNRSASNLGSTAVEGTYNAPVPQSAGGARTSFNGGRAGSHARPTTAETHVANEHSAGPTAEQQKHQRAAESAPGQRATTSHGQPPVAATPHPSGFAERGVEATRPGPVLRPEAAPHGRSEAPVRAEPHNMAPAPAPPHAEAPARAQPRQEAPPRAESHPEPPPRAQPRQDAPPRAESHPEPPPRAQPRQDAPPRAEPRPEAPRREEPRPEEPRH